MAGLLRRRLSHAAGEIADLKRDLEHRDQSLAEIRTKKERLEKSLAELSERLPQLALEAAGRERRDQNDERAARCLGA